MGSTEGERCYSERMEFLPRIRRRKQIDKAVRVPPQLVDSVLRRRVELSRASGREIVDSQRLE